MFPCLNTTSHVIKCIYIFIHTLQATGYRLQATTTFYFNQIYNATIIIKQQFHTTLLIHIRVKVTHFGAFDSLPKQVFELNWGNFSFSINNMNFETVFHLFTIKHVISPYNNLLQHASEFILSCSNF